jgi:hypothetical protein
MNNVGTAATIRSYDNITLGSALSNASVEVDFDNVVLQFSSVPEPASLGLFALAGLLVGRKARALTAPELIQSRETKEEACLRVRGRSPARQCLLGG